MILHAVPDFDIWGCRVPSDHVQHRASKRHMFGSCETSETISLLSLWQCQASQEGLNMGVIPVFPKIGVVKSASITFLNSGTFLMMS